MQLHEYIANNMQSIMLEWEKFTKTLPPGKHMGVDGLRDHAQKILEAIVRDMANPQSDDEQESKSKGGEKNATLQKSAQMHVSTRLLDGFDFDQIVSEYRALRASVIRLWMDRIESADMDSLYQLTRFNEGMDQSLTYVIKEFSEQTEKSRQAFLQDLRESEERHRSLAELSPDALLVNQDGHYVYANLAAARLFGTDDGQNIVGLSPFELLEPEGHETLHAQIKTALEGKKDTRRTEYRWNKLDGTTVEVEVSVGPVQWNGKPAVQIIARDIGARKRTEQALRDVEKHKDEFLATLAHELRNPLAPIQTGIDSLRFASGGQPAEANTLDIMQRQMVYLVRLVDDLVNVSRISQGKVNLYLEKTDVCAAARKAVEANESSLYAGDRQVSIDLPSEPLVVSADPVRLIQIVGNLLSNAGKYTDNDGRIWISAFKTEEHVKISVQDNGIGIAPRNINNVFQMFMQIDEARVGGMGIGLALVRNLVNLHGGTVEVHSKGLGQGSEFVISLPLVQSDVVETPQEDESTLAVPDHMHVLVVDDNEDAANSLGVLLELLGADVRVATGGMDGLNLVDEFRPDLVLLDIGMPEMDGYEVARRIRAKDSASPIRLVAVTGWGQEADRQRSLEAGFDDHMIKPVTLKDLEKVIANL